MTFHLVLHFHYALAYVLACIFGDGCILPLFAAAQWNHFLKKTGTVSAKASGIAIAEAIAIVPDFSGGYKGSQWFQ